MTGRRPGGAAVGLALALLATGCGDDGPGAAPLDAERLCTTLQAWSDASVDAVDAFRVASRTLDPPDRRIRYRAAFDEQSALHDRLAAALADMDLPLPVDERLDGAVAQVAAIVADGAAEADALPDSAYEFRGIRDGHLVTGTEKARAVVSASLSTLADDPSTGVPRACGQREALDISPAVTFPP